MADEERKIFIDEDWKAQVQREKEEARRKAEAARQAQETPAAPVTAMPDAGAAAPPEGADGEELPEGSVFLGLVSSLAAQTMYALGASAPQGAKEVMVDLDFAQYNLEILAMLKEKTAGNLTDEENTHLNTALAELQRLYMSLVQQLQEQTLRQAGIRHPDDLRGK
ncbi:MAG: DUF1844 domain-containing protein [Candidatus Hydrogenedentes bacterium]|nr:DUF1844 domain-containing protein [Candidatus Hydrogenedentota bacterium]